MSPLQTTCLTSLIMNTVRSSNFCDCLPRNNGSYSFLTSILHGGQRSASNFCRFIPWEGTRNTHWISGVKSVLSVAMNQRFFFI
jgi:hypothetical protein